MCCPFLLYYCPNCKQPIVDEDMTAAQIAQVAKNICGYCGFTPLYPDRPPAVTSAGIAPKQQQIPTVGSGIGPKQQRIPSITSGSIVTSQPIHRVSAKEHAVRMRDHEIVVELGNNKKLMSALGELDESPESLAEAVEDGNKFLKKRQVKVPAKTTFKFKKRGKGWDMDVYTYAPRFVYRHRYNSEKGLIQRG